MHHIIRLTFENIDNEDPSKSRYFGYQIDRTSLTYVTAEFDREYQILSVSEKKPIGDLTIFSQRITQIIRRGLEGQ